MNLALGVDMTLLIIIFTVIKSAVGVPQSPGQSMRLPLTVIRTLLGSSFPDVTHDVCICYILFSFLGDCHFSDENYGICAFHSPWDAMRQSAYFMRHATGPNFLMFGSFY